MTSSDARKQLLYALRQVLRPIVRISDPRRHPLRRILRASLGGVYIESAIPRRRSIAASTPTRERIALATGVLPGEQVDHYIENEGEAAGGGADARASDYGSVASGIQIRSTLRTYMGFPIRTRIRRASVAATNAATVSTVDPNVSAGLTLDELLRVGSSCSLGRYALSYGFTRISGVRAHVPRANRIFSRFAHPTSQDTRAQLESGQR